MLLSMSAGVQTFWLLIRNIVLALWACIKGITKYVKAKRDVSRILLSYLTRITLFPLIFHSRHAEISESD